ncbi:putative nucleoside-diphosphate-sugar epimerase [Podospora conica]|nr:putative nucleoside-diphosphate-sugar epimerase [Schizothecium conicum]
MTTRGSRYIGGDAFYVLYHTHPEYEYTLAVRNESRVKPVRDKYPDTDKIRIVYGTDQKSYEAVLEEESTNADIVLHTAESADHIPSAEAISKGVTKASHPIYYIHLSGTGILQWYDKTNSRYGHPPLPTESYDDITSLPRLLTLPDSALHREVDKLVLATNHASPGSCLTAIVAPPTIYGVGRGPVNTRSQQLPNLARFILRHGFAPVVGPPGETQWDNTHISDVSRLFLLLVETAAGVLGGEREVGAEVFGGRAYYFCDNGKPHVWREVAVTLAETAVRLGYLKEVVVKMVGIDEVPDPSWGMNLCGRASRARKYLGWEAVGPGLEGEWEGIVKEAAEALGVEGM